VQTLINIGSQKTNNLSFTFDTLFDDFTTECLGSSLDFLNISMNQQHSLQGKHPKLKVAIADNEIEK